MCYHVSTPNLKKLEVFAKDNRLKFSDGFAEQYESYYHVNGFIRPFLPVVSSVSKRLELARWKLIPGWIKTETEAKKYANTLNAEGETIFEKASYKNYIGKYRGLLLVDGFFEPHQVAGQKETENFYITYPDHAIFTLGVVISPWKDETTGQHYDTFSILTTEANKRMAEIHNIKKRMPLVIPENKRRDWLTASTKEEIKNLIQPLEDGILKDWQVQRVTGARQDDTNIAAIQDPIS